MENQNYWGDKHNYMLYQKGAFSEFIFAAIEQLTKKNFANVDAIIELGAGMGRFSHAFIGRFPKVYLVEPSPVYAQVLRELFPQANVKVIEEGAERFFQEFQTGDDEAVCFCFHVLHHLSQEQRSQIFESIQRLKIDAFFIDPNPFNPLILLQILIHPAMKFEEEKGYLKLTRRKLLNECAACGLSKARHFYFCLLPPTILNRTLSPKLSAFLLRLESLALRCPVFASYQMLYVQPETPTQETKGSHE
jgi:hypothetical protein